jgi:hypothetical protein
MQERSKRIQIYKANHKTPLKPSLGMANTKLLLQRSKTRRIEGFGENVSGLPLCINEFHHNISFLNMISQQVVSHFDVFGSPIENWVLG